MLIVLRYHLRVSTHGKDILGIVEVNNNSLSLFLATNFLVATKISQSVKSLNIVKSQRGYLQDTSIPSHFHRLRPNDVEIPVVFPPWFF